MFPTCTYYYYYRYQFSLQYQKVLHPMITQNHNLIFLLGMEKKSTVVHNRWQSINLIRNYYCAYLQYEWLAAFTHTHLYVNEKTTSLAFPFFSSSVRLVPNALFDEKGIRALFSRRHYSTIMRANRLRLPQLIKTQSKQHK